MNHFDVIILGAGGAGLMCAATASQNGKSTLLLDHAEKPGKKILISGGGRCNFTNLNIFPERFLSKNPHFAKSALNQYTQHDFIDLVNRHKIDWHEKTLGQLFCDVSAKQIVNMLLDECNKGGVKLELNCSINRIEKQQDSFSVKTSNGTFTASNLVIATGGPSIPKMGASDFAYKIARQFGLKIIEPKPALVPLTLGPDDVLFKELSGVASDVITKFGKTSFEEAALFTHKGLSGPAILQISSYWQNGKSIGINFLPDNKQQSLVDLKRSNPKANLKSYLKDAMPERLSKALSDLITKEFSVEGPLSSLSDSTLQSIQEKLRNWEFHPNGTEGYAKAEVTIGGISTDELSSKTMECKKVKGLYAIGEAVDVTGWLGGYNFQWAWSSGYVAGNSIE